jgi:predicted transposase YbfD/YdcC
VASLPVEGAEELKRTNEIKMAIPLLDAIDIQGKQVTADALLTQRKLADYLVRKRKAHYHFTVKANQPKLFQDIKLFFQDRRQPESSNPKPCAVSRRKCDNSRATYAWSSTICA